jgi:hypothetical protein
LKIDPIAGEALPLALVASNKGDTVYSIGYPFDLGITVVPGTYNGLAPHSANQRVHFTGSLNPGMSGGPAFNESAEVIGINVATSGNQVSFLVPVSNLIDLYDGTSIDMQADLNQVIASQLQANSGRMIGQMLNGDWSTVPLGKSQALDEITGFLRCWGNSKNTSDKTDKKPFWAQRSCQTDHNIYINRGFNTGKIEIQSYWIESEELNSLQFYNYYERIFSRYRPGNRGREKDLGNWDCAESFIQSENTDETSHPSVGEVTVGEVTVGEVTKAVFCARAYKAFAGVYDILFLQGNVSGNNEANMIHFTIAGTTRELGLAFTRRFMNAGIW